MSVRFSRLTEPITPVFETSPVTLSENGRTSHDLKFSLLPRPAQSYGYCSSKCRAELQLVSVSYRVVCCCVTNLDGRLVDVKAQRSCYRCWGVFGFIFENASERMIITKTLKANINRTTKTRNKLHAHVSSVLRKRSWHNSWKRGRVRRVGVSGWAYALARR